MKWLVIFLVFIAHSILVSLVRLSIINSDLDREGAVVIAGLTATIISIVFMIIYQHLFGV